MATKDKFDREEVTFSHGDEDFIFVFERYDSGVITFRRVRPLNESPEAEVMIHPNGNRQSINTAVVALFKSQAFPSADPKSYLELALRKMLQIFFQKDALLKNLAKAVATFPSKTPIANVDQLINFILPYTQWVLWIYIWLTVESQWHQCHAD
jgi:hypothetical protein